MDSYRQKYRIATPMPAIVFSDDDDDNSWCGDCDALLYERKDGSMICSNPQCGRNYLPSEVKKHKRHLGPVESPYDDSDVPLVSLSDYANPQRKKPSVFDREDRLFESKSGRYFTEHEDYFP